MTPATNHGDSELTYEITPEGLGDASDFHANKAREAQREINGCIEEAGKIRRGPWSYEASERLDEIGEKICALERVRDGHTKKARAARKLYASIFC